MAGDEIPMRSIASLGGILTKSGAWKQTGVQLFRFSIVGIVATLVHTVTALFYLANFGSTALLANTLGYLVALSVSFCGNMYWVFPRQSRLLPAVIRFFAISSLAFSSTAAISFVFDWFEYPPEWSIPLVLLTAPCLSFIGNRFWVFKS